MSQLPKNSVVLSTKEVVTSQQVQSVLEILAGIEPFLLVPLRHEDSDRPADLDGGVACGAATTFLKATSRLDAILDDESRWGIKGHNDVQNAILRTQACQQTFLEQQSLAAKEIRRPSFIYRPAVYTHDGLFYAVWGDAASPDCSIAGAGETPEAALLDFDAAFKRVSLEQVTFILEHHTAPQEPIPSTPLTIKPSRKKKI